MADVVTEDEGRKKWGDRIGRTEEPKVGSLKWVRGCGLKREEMGLGALTSGHTTPPQSTSGSDHIGAAWGWEG